MSAQIRKNGIFDLLLLLFWTPFDAQMAGWGLSKRTLGWPRDPGVGEGVGLGFGTDRPESNPLPTLLARNGKRPASGTTTLQNFNHRPCPGAPNRKGGSGSLWGPTGRRPASCVPPACWPPWGIARRTPP